MSDAPAAAAAALQGPSDTSPASTPAIISYLIIGLFALIAVGVFAIIFREKELDPVMVGVLGSLLAVVTTSLGGVTGFWLASSAGARQNSAALRQIAGSGAPPPADPNLRGGGIVAVDRPALEAMVDSAIAASADVTPTAENHARISAEVMKQTNGTADPALVATILVEKLGPIPTP